MSADESEIPPGTLGVVIEMDMILATMEERRYACRGDFFEEMIWMWNCSRKANDEMHQPEMRIYTPEWPEEDDYQYWTLSGHGYLKDPPMTRQGGRSFWSMKLTSPIFHAAHGLDWRHSVEVLYRLLNREYKNEKNESLKTAIHVTIRDDFNLDQLQRIGRSIIHFEPAFEVTAPPTRRGDTRIKSNWLDNAALGASGKLRMESMGTISRTTSLSELVDILSPDDEYGWNFRNLLEDGNGTIEFRLGKLTFGCGDALSVTEVVMAFIQSALSLGNVHHFVKRDAESMNYTYASKWPSTVGGLKAFLREGQQTQKTIGIWDNGYINLFFDGHADDSFQEPIPNVTASPAESGERDIQAMVDAHRIRQSLG